ncbi:MAG: sulfurtransferase [Acidimicrobiaceae bacterium]|nr:sulfurtransferase [Acidimicrobiaceae bacterium]
MSRIESLLERTRSELDRVEVAELSREMAEGALLVDIRPEINRALEGEIPEALVIDRNVLEWRLDPTSPDRIPQADRLGRRIIVFCNDGYASTLAAASLRDLGLERATDLAGGYRAWSAQRSRNASD